MKDEEIRIAIAEACGWYQSKTYRLGEETGKRLYYWRREEHRNSNDPRKGERLYLPNYLNDLNAIHEAEKVIEAIMHERGDDYAYGDKLVEVTQDVRPIHATARQRCEAFLRTLNLWQE